MSQAARARVVCVAMALSACGDNAAPGTGVRATGSQVPPAASSGALDAQAKQAVRYHFYMLNFVRNLGPVACEAARVRVGSAPDDIRTDLWGTAIRVDCVGGGYELRSAGPNRTFADQDDLTAKYDDVDLSKPLPLEEPVH